MNNEQWTFTEPEAARNLRESKERARYEFTVTYFTTNSTTKEVRAVTKLDTWQIFRYKHPLFSHSMQYEAMITAAGDLKVTTGTNIFNFAKNTITNVLANEYAALHKFTKADRYKMAMEDMFAEGIEVIKLGFADVWIMQFSDKSGYYLEVEIFAEDDGVWTSSTVWATQPTKAEAIRALLSEGGNDVEF